MINGFSAESEKSSPASECNLIQNCLRLGDREKKQSWPGPGWGRRMCYMWGQTTLDWGWRGRSHTCSPSFLSRVGRTILLGRQRSLPSIPATRVQPPQPMSQNLQILKRLSSNCLNHPLMKRRFQQTLQQSLFPLAHSTSMEYRSPCASSSFLLC